MVAVGESGGMGGMVVGGQVVEEWGGVFGG